MEQWEKDLREEIGSIMRNSQVNNIKKKKKKKITLKSFLLVLFLILFVSNFFVLEYKHPGCTFHKLVEIKNSLFTKKEVKNNNIQKMLDKICVRISNLEKNVLTEKDKEEIKLLTDRLLLIAIVQDENAAISRKLLGEYTYEAEEFIHIDPEWNIDRIPTHIEITPEAERFLRERLSN